MAIRPATLADAHAIIDIAENYARLYPELRVEHDKVRQLVITAISSAAHFCWVSVDNLCVVQGVLAGLTGENMWAQRKNCGVPVWVSRIPGDGVAMLREFKKWLGGRRAIRVAGFAPDLDVDARTWKIVERLGFKPYGGAFLLYN